MWFSQAEGVEAGGAGELPAAGRTSARPNPRTEGRKGCGPVPGSPGWGAAAFLPTPGHSRPSHRLFSALGLRLPVAATITICKALPVDAPRADPTARCGRAGGAAPGVPGPGLTVSGVRGPPGASQLRQGGGGWGVSSDTAWCLRRRCLSPGHYPRYPARGAQESRTPIPAVPPTTWSPNAEPRGARGRPSPRHCRRPGLAATRHFLRHRPRRG